VRRRSTQALASALVTIAVVGAAGAGAAASPLDDARSRAASLTVQVHRLQDESETAAERYAGATAELGTAVSRYQAGARRLDAARSDLDKQRTRSRLRVRAMWEGGGTLGMLSGALRSGDIGSLSSRLAAVRHVTQDDYDKMLAAASAAGKARELATALDALALRQTQLRGKAQAALQTAQAGADAQRTLLARAGQDVAVLVEQQRQDEASRSAAAFRARLTAAIGAARAASAVRVARAAQAAAAARAAAGIALPRTAAQQWLSGPHPSIEQMQPGDLLFWASDPSDMSSIHHVALYLGGDMMISTDHPGDVARVQPIWDEEFVGATRPDPALALTVAGPRWAAGT